MPPTLRRTSPAHPTATPIPESAPRAAPENYYGTVPLPHRPTKRPNYRKQQPRGQKHQQHSGFYELIWTGNAWKQWRVCVYTPLGLLRRLALDG